jgi:D-glycero-alpha-D-manno-heptose-7-phosphate kinase
LGEVKNAIARECIRLLKVEPPIYISTIADLPALSGLGSSSSFAVGLLNALHALKGERPSAGLLAEEAACVEIEILKHPIGKQDHYAVAFGGINYICFLSDGGVSIEPQKISLSEIHEIFGNLLMFWTGITRSAGSILLEQKNNSKQNVTGLLTMRDQAKRMRDLIQNGFDLESFGTLLNEGWQLKRELASGITNHRIDAWYTRAMESGALGGKLCGAGGGGFLLFIVKPKHKKALRQALSDLYEVPIGYEAQGSSILLSSR